MRVRCSSTLARPQYQQLLLPGIRPAPALGQYELIHTDAFDWLSNADRNSFHTVVTDPPTASWSTAPRSWLNEPMERGASGASHPRLMGTDAARIRDSRSGAGLRWANSVSSFINWRVASIPFSCPGRTFSSRHTR